MLTLFYLVNLNKLIIMKNLCVTTLTFLLIFGACKKKDSTKSSSYTPSCSGTKSYLVDVKPLMQSYCVSCHSNYNSYTTVKSSSSSIRNSIVNGSMPQGSSLTDDQKNNIVCWIDAGAPNN